MIKNVFKSIFAYLGLLWIPLMSVSLKLGDGGRNTRASLLLSWLKMVFIPLFQFYA
jgi:hypothetical protein